MKVEELRGYGLSISEFEENWSDDFRKKIKKSAKKIILSHLSLFQKFSLAYYYIKEKKRALRLDLSDLRVKGLKNEKFILQQLDYLAMFSALSRILGTNNTLEIMYEVMDATAGEAMLQNAPTYDEITSIGDNFVTFKDYFAPLPEASKKTGCHLMEITENTDQAFQLDIHYCAWFELAKKMGIPEACLPNCYADDYAYPEYYRKLGIKYARKGTLAKGNPCCDMRFERL